jgi:hypothetical protein
MTRALVRTHVTRATLTGGIDVKHRRHQLLHTYLIIAFVACLVTVGGFTLTSSVATSQGPDANAARSVVQPLASVNWGWAPNTSVNWGSAPLASVNWGWAPNTSVNWG